MYFIAYYSGLLHASIFMFGRMRKNHPAVILFYHRFTSGKMASYHLPHLERGEFEKQMKHIKRWYEVVTMDKLAEEINNGKKLRAPNIAITIDDGYHNNYTLAFPILRKLQLPATIYLTTGFINTNRAPWVDELLDMLLETKVKTLCLPEILSNEILDISTPVLKRAAVKKLFHVLLRLEHDQRIRLLQRLSEILKADSNFENNGKRKMLTWDEIAEMSQHNISFGAHTVTHSTLSTMELNEAKAEIYNSKHEIEKKVGVQVNHFAIPNGKKEDFNDELKQYCREIGLKTSASTEPGVVYSLSDPYFLNRILPPAPISVFACELARYIFFGKQNHDSANSKLYRCYK